MRPYGCIADRVMLRTITFWNRGVTCVLISYGLKNFTWLLGILSVRGKKHGGLGVFSAKSWNYAAATELLWMIHLKKDLLWIKWIHGNYLQNQNVWEIQGRTYDSWMWRQILKVRDMLINKFGSTDNVKNAIEGCFSKDKLKLSEIYMCLIQPMPKVSWFSTAWDEFLYPKHSFILWLACNQRLLTKDRLCRMGMMSSNQNQCVLCCGHQLETSKHIFFECQFSADVWNRVMDWMRFRWRSCYWDLIISWYSCNLKGRGPLRKLKRMCLSAAVYMIWDERNRRIFQGKMRDPSQIFRAIRLSVFTRVLNVSSHAHMIDLLEVL
ncbi:uncharacterized protein LOC109839233 [Asparagus officinalis]|uniref:uncharacterized protein LOC109839233 n=1 Tax=Asparagus officinalis TaxID=4686 RepID=UPI00098DFF6F|nr:uncharacterized protein LOC109839233 [Asparagus officinalis]